MKKTTSVNSMQDQQEKMIEKSLRTGGFIFPETVDEVKEFERIFGTTDVILPTELQEPSFLYTQPKKGGKAIVAKLQPENLAMVARDGFSQLPDEIKKRMAQDRKNADTKRKRKK